MPRWELNAHGYDQILMHKVEDQLADIKKAMAIVGNLGPPARVAGSGRA